MAMTPSKMPPTPAREFVVERTVRFDDCDPAGIVFYPRYFYMINAVVEDWWQHIGQPWRELIMSRRLVTPVSHLDTVFLRPSMMGDILHCHLSVESVSRSSFRLHHRIVGADGLERFRLRQRMVCASLDGLQPVAWPNDIKTAISAWLHQESRPAGS